MPKTPDANFTPIPGTASTPTPTPTTTHTTTGPTVARKWLKTRKLIGRELRSTIVGGPTTVPSLNDDDGSEGDPYYDLDDDLETEAEGGGGGISTVFPCTSLALYDCDADNFDELTFHAGDRIRVLRTVRYDDEWWVSADIWCTCALAYVCVCVCVCVCIDINNDQYWPCIFI